MDWKSSSNSMGYDLPYIVSHITHNIALSWVFPTVFGTLIHKTGYMRRGELNQLAHYVRSNAVPGDLVVVVVQCARVALRKPLGISGGMS